MGNVMEAVFEVVLWEALAIVVRLAWSQLVQWLAERRAGGWPVPAGAVA
jgi:hypothetical protein